MSRIPYLDELGDTLESAVAYAERERKRPAILIVAASFIVALVAVTVTAFAFRGGDSPAATDGTTVTATTAALPTPATPSSWARIDLSIASDSRFTVSSVAFTGEGYVAAGSAAGATDGSDAVGYILSSVDGTQWVEVARLPGVTITDITATDGGVRAVGTRGATAVLIDPDREQPVTELPSVGSVASNSLMVPTAITSVGDGLIVVGHLTSLTGSGTSATQEQRPVVWRSDDGALWEVIQSEAFALAPEATIEDVVVADGTIYAGGLIGRGDGTSQPVLWTTKGNDRWTRIDLPAGSMSGFAGVTGLAVGSEELVAVGFVPSTGGGRAAAWMSPDGTSWELVEDPSIGLGLSANTSTRMAAVVATADGFVAVGHVLERPDARYAIWTADMEAASWTRLDLDDLDDRWSTTLAYDLAAGRDGIVAVGAGSDLSFGEAAGLVWVGPSPAGQIASVPIVGQPEVSTATATINPSVAVMQTRVRIDIVFPRSVAAGESQPIWLVPPNGPPIEFCTERTRGRALGCQRRLDDLAMPVAEGPYGIAYGDDIVLFEDVTLTVMPPGTEIVTMAGIYNNMMWPLLQSLFVQNRGATDLDITGWVILNANYDEPRFTFPTGTVVPPGASATLDFGGPGGGICPPSTVRYFHWCSVVSDSGRIDYPEEDYLWKGGRMFLIDGSGTIRAEWTRP